MAQEDDSGKSSYSDPNGGYGGGNGENGSMENNGKSLGHVPLVNSIEFRDLQLNPTPMEEDGPVEEGCACHRLQDQVNVSDPRPWSGFLSGPNMNYHALFPSGSCCQQPFPGGLCSFCHSSASLLSVSFNGAFTSQVSFPLVSFSSVMGSSKEPPSNQINRNSFTTSVPPPPDPPDQAVCNARFQRGNTDAQISNVNRKNNGSNETVTRDFLSLSPPPPPAARTERSSTISSFRHPKPAASIQPTTSGLFNTCRDQMEAIRKARDQTLVQRTKRRSQQPVCSYYNFFPPATEQIRDGGSNGSEESLDLELRLRPNEPDKHGKDDKTQQLQH